MSALQEGERRCNSRHQASLQLLVQELSPPGTAPTPAAAIHGEIRNISSGGLCALLDQACQVSGLLRCEIFVAECPVAIPTLVHVRWVENGEGKCVAGLEFLPQSPAP